MRAAATALLLALPAATAGCGSSAEPPAAGAPGSTAPAASRSSATATPLAIVTPGRGETLAVDVRKTVTLLAAPADGAPPVARIGRRTKFGSEAVLAVVRQRGPWLGVVAPALDNGRLGWVRQGTVRLLRELWSIDVDLSQRRATLRHRGRVYRTFAVAVGTPTYPTPTGRFGVTDRLSTGGPGSAYGCCILALSGHQRHVPQDWPGGDRIAIHGTNEPASIGGAASHGCLRASEATMQMLMARVPLGTEVVIHS